VLLFDEVELLDFAAPVQVLSIAGRHYNFRPFKIVTTALVAGPVSTRNQIEVQARCELAACPPAEVLIVPGGYGARRAIDDASLSGFIATQAARAELILTTGYGCLLLARAGVCAGERLAVPAEIEALFRELEPSALTSSEDLVHSGKILSARDSAGALGLGLKTTQLLLGDKFAAQVASRLGARMPEAASGERLQIVKPDG